jgi:hypothetical protein
MRRVAAKQVKIEFRFPARALDLPPGATANLLSVFFSDTLHFESHGLSRFRFS